MNKNNLIKIVVAVLVLVGFVYFVGNKTEKKNSYIDDVSKFSMSVPEGWNLVNKTNSTTTSSTQFSNGSSTIVVKRFDRTESVEQAINFMGKAEFYMFLSDQLVIDIPGYTVVATTTSSLNNTEVYKITGKYVGKNTQKEVTQNAYIFLNDKSYYIVGVDVYTDIWSKDEKAVSDMVNSFKLL